jgi:hypothetical protein
MSVNFIRVGGIVDVGFCVGGFVCVVDGGYWLSVIVYALDGCN